MMCDVLFFHMVCLLYMHDNQVFFYLVCVL